MLATSSFYIYVLCYSFIYFSIFGDGFWCVCILRYMTEIVIAGWLQIVLVVWGKIARPGSDQWSLLCWKGAGMPYVHLTARFHDGAANLRQPWMAVNSKVICWYFFRSLRPIQWLVSIEYYNYSRMLPFLVVGNTLVAYINIIVLIILVQYPKVLSWFCFGYS